MGSPGCANVYVCMNVRRNKECMRLRFSLTRGGVVLYIDLYIFNL